MKIRLPLQQLILALTAGILLLVQISGLHRHLHLEMLGAVHQQTSALHFGDAGLHTDESRPAQAGDTGTVDHHAHGTVEIAALGDALAKIAIDLLPVLLLAAMLFVLAPRVALRVPRPDSLTAVPRSHPFALHPPANGPPRLISQPL